MTRVRNVWVRGSRRGVEDLLGRAGLDDAAGVEEAHRFGDLAGEAHLVGGDHHRHAARPKVANDVEDLADELGVERRGDLVEQHHVGVHRQRPGDGDALLLATGQLIGIGVRLGAETQTIEQLCRLLGGGGGRCDPQLARRQRDVVDHRAGEGTG